MLIGDLLARRARISPAQEAWREAGQSFTYGRLDADANRAARALLALGLRPGDIAAICADNSYAYLCLQYGAAKAGVVLAHLHARLAAAELAQQVARCGATLLAFGPEQAAGAEAVTMDRVRHRVLLPGAGEPAGGSPSTQRGIPFRPWLQRESAEPPLLPEGTALDDAQPYQMLFTSGTTGAPKAALISHRAKLRQGTTHALNLGLRPGDRILSALPLSHQFAQWLVGVCAPVAGAAVVTLPRFDAAHYWQTMEQEDITHLPAVPTMLYRLLEHPGRAPALRLIVYGAAPMDAQRVRELRARFPGVRLFQGFGQTETGYCLGLHDADHDLRPDALGKPDLFSELRLLDEQGRDVPDGAVGEIVARTPYLMQGYHGDAAATRDYFAFGPEWGRTGDLARRDADGYYVLAGRKQDLIISGGENVYPAEVERVLLTHPAIADAAVLGVPHPDWGEAVHAALVLKDRLVHAAAEALPAALEAFCRKSLAGFKCPRRFSFHEEFPRTANGKVRKFELREQVLRAAGRD